MEKQHQRINEHIAQLNQFLEKGVAADFLKLFLDLHPYEQGQFYTNLDLAQQQQVSTWLTVEQLAHMFNDINFSQVDVAALVKVLSPKRLAAVVDAMYSDNSGQMLTYLDPETLAQYEPWLSATDSQMLEQLAQYPEESAGALMGGDFIAVPADITVTDAMQAIKEAALHIELFQYIYVIDHAGDLLGVLSFRALILNEPDTKVHEVMNQHVITVEPTVDQEVVAHVMADYNFVALPVVESGHLVGVITIDDIVHVIDEEATQDYSGLAGTDVDAPQQNPFYAALKRLPWLIGLIFLGLGTSTIIDGYDDLIAKASVLAVFVSLITGTGGNAGTQSLAVAIRRLSLGERPKLLRAFITELLIGTTVGAIAGTTIFLVVWLWKGDFILGMAVGLAMAMAILIANIAGAFIPRIMNHFGIDPAVASGPFITTMSDLTSVIIYFTIAGMFITHFMN